MSFGAFPVSGSGENEGGGSSGSGGIPTTANFVMPAAGPPTTVNVPVATTLNIKPNSWVYIVQAGYLKVTAIPDASHITLENLGFVGNAAAGTNIPAGSIVTPTGDETGFDVYDVRRYGATPNDVAPGVSAAFDAAAAASGGTIYIPALQGGAHWKWRTNVSKVVGLGGLEIYFKGEAGCVVDFLLANTHFYALHISNLFNGTLGISDIVFIGSNTGVQDVGAVINFEVGASQSIIERCGFYGIATADADTGMIMAANADIKDCTIVGCGHVGIRGGTIMIQGGNNIISHCSFADLGNFDGVGYGPIEGATGAWVWLPQYQQVRIESCFLDEDQHAAVWSHLTNVDDMLQASSIVIQSCFFNVSNPALGPNQASIIVDALGVNQLEIDQCSFNDAANRTVADLTNVSQFTFTGSNGSYSDGQHNVNMSMNVVSRAGNGKWTFLGNGDIRLDTSLGAPKNLTSIVDGNVIVNPTSIPGCVLFLLPDVGNTQTNATTTGAAATYAAVTAGHHLDLKIDGLTFVVTFAGTENTQALFHAAINAVGPFTASNAAGQTKLTVNNSINGINSGEILGTSSADVLTSLGLAAGVFATPANVTALVDQSGLNDATHNVTSGAGVAPSFVPASTNFNNRPTLSFAAAAKLLSSVWSAALPQPFTVVVVGRQSTAAGTRYAFDGLAANTGAVFSRFEDETFHLDAGTDAIVTGYGTGLDVTAPSDILAQFVGASSGAAINSVEPPNSPIDPGVSGITGTTIGQKPGSVVNGGWEIAAIIVYNRVIFLQDATDIQNWTSRTFGIDLFSSPNGIPAGTEGEVLLFTNGVWTSVTQTANFVQAANAGVLGPAATVSQVAGPIQQQKSGAVRVSGSISGTTDAGAVGSTVTVTLLRDAVVLATEVLPTIVAGQLGFSCDLSWIDTLPDAANHNYTVKAAVGAGNLTVPIGQAIVNANEL